MDEDGRVSRPPLLLLRPLVPPFCWAGRGVAHSPGWLSLVSPEPKSLCRASSYFFCFSSLSSRAFCCRSSNVITTFPESCSSSSSSSSRLSCCNPIESTAPAALGVGLRLRTFTAGLKSVFRGTSFRVFRKYESLGASLQTRKDEPTTDNFE